MMRDRIDGVIIDPDENGFHLILSGEEREYNFTLDASAAASLLTAVKTEIEPWWTEADLIRQGRLHEAAEVASGIPVPVGDLFDPYELDDEGYHDRMSGIWDDREKT